MHPYSLTHLSDAVLLHGLKSKVSRESLSTAELVAHIAEVDLRRLYVAEGYPSMFAYCVDELRLAEGATYKRILAARAARRFPVLFLMLGDGRLHLTAVRFLAPHLTPENAQELLASAVGLRTTELEDMLRRRFPVVERTKETAAVEICPLPAPELDFGALTEEGPSTAPLPELVLRPVAPAPSEGANPALLPTVGDATGEVPTTDSSPSHELVLRPVEAEPAAAVPECETARAEELPAIGSSLTPELVSRPVAGQPVIAPDEPSDRVVLRISMRTSTREKLRHLQALLSHAIPSGDMGEVLDRACDVMIAEVEKKRFARTARPAPVSGGEAAEPRSPRLIPAWVRRAVWERDGGQCAFIAESRRRCGSRHFLEFDHVQPVARGGRASLEGIRLRCRTHNDYEARKVFGDDFMASRRAREPVSP